MMFPVLWFSGVDPYRIGLAAAAMELLIALLERLAKRREQKQR